MKKSSAEVPTSPVSDLDLWLFITLFFTQSTVHCEAGLKWMAMSYDDIRNICLKVIRVIIFYTENGRSFSKAERDREKQEKNTNCGQIRKSFWPRAIFRIKIHSQGKCTKLFIFTRQHAFRILSFVDKQLVYHTHNLFFIKASSFITIIHNSLSLSK
jgi:hypothetical protein